MKTKSWFSAPRVVLLLLCVMYLILYVDRVNVATAAPLIKAELRLTNTELGVAFSAFAFPYALLQIFGGWIGDKFGPRLTLTVSCAIVAVSTAMTGAAGGLMSLFFCRLALGIGEGAAFPTATRAMSSWTPKESWGFAQGITHSFSRIGNAMTPPLITALVAVVSWRGSFVILGFASLIWLTLWSWYFRNEPSDHRSITKADLAVLPPRSTGNASNRVPSLRLARRILPVTLVDFCYGWTLWLFLSWIPSFFVENYHLNLQSSALFTSGVLFSGVIGDTLGGVISDRLLKATGRLQLARVYLIAVGFLGALAFMIPVVLIHDLTTAAICLSLAFFFAELIVAPIWAMPMDIAPQYAGSASGMMNFGFGTAGIVSPIVFGFLLDRTGNWGYPFAASIALLLAGAALVFRVHPDRQLVREAARVAGAGSPAA